MERNTVNPYRVSYTDVIPRGEKFNGPHLGNGNTQMNTVLQKPADEGLLHEEHAYELSHQLEELDSASQGRAEHEEANGNQSPDQSQNNHAEFHQEMNHKGSQRSRMLLAGFRSKVDEVAKGIESHDTSTSQARAKDVADHFLNMISIHVWHEESGLNQLGAWDRRHAMKLLGKGPLTKAILYALREKKFETDMKSERYKQLKDEYFPDLRTEISYGCSDVERDEFSEKFKKLEKFTNKYFSRLLNLERVLKETNGKLKFHGTNQELEVTELIIMIKKFDDLRALIPQMDGNQARSILRAIHDVQYRRPPNPGALDVIFNVNCKNYEKLKQSKANMDSALYQLIGAVKAELRQQIMANQ